MGCNGIHLSLIIIIITIYYSHNDYTHPHTLQIIFRKMTFTIHLKLYLQQYYEKYQEKNYVIEWLVIERRFG